MPKFANIFLFNRLPAPGGGGILYYGFSGSKVTTINYYGVLYWLQGPGQGCDVGTTQRLLKSLDEYEQET
jgi:hypothetical protein